MRRLLWTCLICLSLSTTAGCFIPAFSGDPTTRTREMIFVSENMRMILQEWQRFWLLEQPSHLTPFRTHGGIV